MSTTPPDEPAHDEMLRTALRHAPDRDARPPEALSAQILRTAQQAAARAMPAATPSPWARAGRTMAAWLGALMRPAPAAAFATLMLGTAIGVMWREGPPPEERAEREGAAPIVQQRAATRDTAEASAAGPAAARQHAEADIEGGSPQPKRATAPAERRAPADPSRSAPPPGGAPAPKSAPEATVRRAPAAPPEAVRASPSPGVGAMSAEQNEPPPTPPLGASPARSDTAVTTPAAQAADDARRADGNASANRERRSETPAAAAARIEAAPASAAPSPVTRAARVAAVPADPLATLAQGWPGASDDQRAALDELRRLSAGRWSLVAAPADVPRALAQAGGEGQPPGRLTITDDAVFWQPPGIDDRVWRAPLPPGTATELRRRLALAPGR